MISKSEIKRLNALKIKKYRSIHRKFVVEGTKTMSDFLSEGFLPEVIYHIGKIDSLLQAYPQFNYVEIDEPTLKRISNLERPASCLAIFDMPESSAEDILANSDWIIALDDLQDPGNLGTIIRIADWFGIRTIVCSDNTVDAFNPKVIQASMGSLSRVNIFNLDLINWLKSVDDRKVYAGVLDGEDIRGRTFEKKGVLIIGNEGRGLRPEVSLLADVALSIPRLGKAESLNAAVAGGIMTAFALLSR